MKREFEKLDAIDQKVLLWLTVHSPESVSSWIDITAEHYRLSHGISINPGTLLAEITAGLH